MDSEKRSLARIRIACAAVALAALFFIIRRVNVQALVGSLRSMRPGWFLAAVAAYGALFVPATWRWHLALRLNRSAVGPVTTARLSLIGHFFYTILFGAVGGDAAKSAVYSRWYKLPMPTILAAASLDRLLGFGGLILFAAAAFAVGAAHGAFAQFKSLSFQWPGWWLLAAAIVLAGMVLAIRSCGRESAWCRYTTALSESGRRLMGSPKTFLSGLLCAFLVQLALSGTLALSLQAVSHGPVPWGRLAWTFPVISIISALPITVAGIGARDGAALALLGMCGVPGADAVAASLLTMTASLAWAVAGGMILWHEAARRKERVWKLVLGDARPLAGHKLSVKRAKPAFRRARRLSQSRRAIPRY